jgi:hypothetical protein
VRPSSRRRKIMRGRLLIPLVLVLSAVVLGVLPSATAGIAVKLPTWTGVDVGRFTVAVVASDLNGDGRQDLAWGRDDFFQDSITVQLSGPNGRLGAPHTYPAAARRAGHRGRRSERRRTP